MSFNCKYCEKMLETRRAFSNHELRCKSNPDRNPEFLGKGRPIIRQSKLVGPPSPKYCLYCNTCYVRGTSTSAFGNHIVRCKLNPNRMLEEKTEEGKKKIAYTLNKANERWKNPEEKAKFSKKMLEVAKNNPQSYSQKNIRRGKKVVVYKNIKFDNSWELDFYKWCENSNINCIRNTRGFQYKFDKIRTYYPDFYIPQMNLYVEIKGRETEKNKAKWTNFPEKLLILKRQEIDLIRRNNYNISM